MEKAMASRQQLAKKTTGLSKREKIVQYYEEAGPDYESWSPSFNMHFGWYDFKLNPLNREAMLNRMNEEVMNRLQIKNEVGSIIFDMGCGLGAVSRYIAKRKENICLHGVTIVPWQVKKAQALTEKENLAERVFIQEADYSCTPASPRSVDGAFAIESSCYANGRNKRDFIREAARILKPGKILVIADGFLKAEIKGSFLKSIYQNLCKAWVLRELGNINDVKDCLTEEGFQDIVIEDISWRVAVSVAHVPFIVIWFLIKTMVKEGKMLSKERLNNLAGPLLTMVLGLHRKHFSYYLITATKSKK